MDLSHQSFEMLKLKVISSNHHHIPTSSYIYGIYFRCGELMRWGDALNDEQVFILFTLDTKFHFIGYCDRPDRSNWLQYVPFDSDEYETIIKIFNEQLYEPVVVEKKRLNILSEYGLKSDEEYLIPYIEDAKILESSSLVEKAKILFKLKSSRN